MGRRYYRPRRTVVVRPKKKWASNIKINTLKIVPSDTQGLAVPWVALVSNAGQSNLPTPSVLKCGNFKINADLYYSLNSASTIPEGSYHFVAFVAFLPEGNAPANNTQFGNFIAAHPEYILAWKQLEANATTTQASSVTTQKVIFSSRLKRNLNSGDQVVFGILDQTTNSNVRIIQCTYTCQYWTCSN